MIEIVDEQLTHLKGEIRGPPDSPYEDGRFKLDIRIPTNYPFSPPKADGFASKFNAPHFRFHSLLEFGIQMLARKQEPFVLTS